MAYNKIKTRRWYKIYKNVMNKQYLIQKFGMGVGGTSPVCSSWGWLSPPSWCILNVSTKSLHSWQIALWKLAYWDWHTMWTKLIRIFLYLKKKWCDIEILLFLIHVTWFLTSKMIRILSWILHWPPLGILQIIILASSFWFSQSWSLSLAHGNKCTSLCL